MMCARFSGTKNRRGRIDKYPCFVLLSGRFKILQSVLDLRKINEQCCKNEPGLATPGDSFCSPSQPGLDTRMLTTSVLLHFIHL